jgi:tRNA U38,U39,U40 pseudouridine synthase TruA
MGKTPSFNGYYGFNDLGQKVKLGISFDGKKYPGIQHPSEVAAKKQTIKQTIQSIKPKAKKQTTKKKSRFS